MDEDEISYDLTVSDDRKELDLKIKSTGPISAQDYIIYLEVFLTDLIKAQRQREEASSLH